MHKVLTYLQLLLGGLLTLIGAIFVFMYLWEGIIARLGEPDQSLIFWYLPVLFIGLFALTGGVKILLNGIKRLKQSRS